MISWDFQLVKKLHPFGHFAKERADVGLNFANREEGDRALPAKLQERVKAQGFDILPGLIRMNINAAMQSGRTYAEGFAVRLALKSIVCPAITFTDRAHANRVI